MLSTFCICHYYFFLLYYCIFFGLLKFEFKLAYGDECYIIYKTFSHPLLFSHKFTPLSLCLSVSLSLSLSLSHTPSIYFLSSSSSSPCLFLPLLQVDDLKNRLGLDAQAQKVDWGTLGVLGTESLAKLK